MNLINFLMDSMSSDSTVEALSQKAETSKGQTSSFLKLALPILIKYLTQNASSQSGAASLANALTQHTDTSSMLSQFANADSNDGNAIISHILGNDSNSVVESLSGQTGMNTSQITNLLGNMAPGMMSGLSAAASTAQQSQQESSAYDFSGLMSSFGAPSASGSMGGGLFSSLFGGSGSSPFDSSNDGTDLLSSILGFLK